MGAGGSFAAVFEALLSTMLHTTIPTYAKINTYLNLSCSGTLQHFAAHDKIIDEYHNETISISVTLNEGGRHHNSIAGGGFVDMNFNAYCHQNARCNFSFRSGARHIEANSEIEYDSKPWDSRKKSISIDRFSGTLLYDLRRPNGSRLSFIGICKKVHNRF